MPDTIVVVNQFFEKNQYVSPAIVLFLILYAALVAPNLSERVARLFDNSLFNLLIFFLIAYSARINPTIAIIAAIGVMVSLITLNNYKVNKKLTSVVSKVEAPQQRSATLEGMNAPTIADHRQVHMEQVAPSSLTELKSDHGSPVDASHKQELDLSHGAPLDASSQPSANDSCVKRANFRNSFFPQYVNMDPFAYEARFSDGSVAAFDPTEAHASI